MAKRYSNDVDLKISRRNGRAVAILENVWIENALVSGYGNSHVYVGKDTVSDDDIRVVADNWHTQHGRSKPRDERKEE